MLHTADSYISYVYYFYCYNTKHTLYSLFIKLPKFILHLSYFAIPFSVHLCNGTGFLIIYSTTLNMNIFGSFITLRLEFRLC